MYLQRYYSYLLIQKLFGKSLYQNKPDHYYMSKNETKKLVNKKELCPECCYGSVSSCCNYYVDATMPTVRRTKKPDGTEVVSKTYYRHVCEMCKKLCKSVSCGYCNGTGYELDE